MLRKILDSPWTYFGLAALLAVVALASMFDLRLPTRPQGTVEDLRTLADRDDVNVVFLLIDTLRADRLGAYGYERDTSPVMDALAATGIRFAHVQAQSSWTKASMASLWTGSYPRRVGVTRYQHGLSDEVVMPAEILREAGFFTGGIFRNGWVEPNFGFAQGFDVYFRPRVATAPPEKFKRHNPSAHALQGNDWDATESAIEFIRAYGHQRFFLYVHYMDVHQYLYEAESGLFGTSIEDVYDNAIHWTDRNVSALMATLDERDLLKETLVVIASDHGEAFYEHGIEGHARNLYREVTETPLLLVPPFRLEPGVVVDTPVQNVDLWPTVLDLLGLPELPSTDGHSLVPLIEAEARGEPVPEPFAGRPLFAELDRSWGLPQKRPEPNVALVQGPYRLIDNLAFPEQVELFDHQTDAGEQRNLAEKRPELVTELRGRVKEGLLDTPRAFKGQHVELDAMRIMQLRALGYVDVGKGSEDGEATADGDGAGPDAAAETAPAASPPPGP